MYDAVVIGAGTAGMTAGIYLARQGASAVILEGSVYGGQIINSPKIENYPAVKSISGFDFATGLYEQVSGLGGRIEQGAVSSIELNGEFMTVVTENGRYDAHNVIIAVGARNRHLGMNGEEALVGRGVSYCAACDGAFFGNKSVAVIGGGNTALDDAVYLSDICERVYLVHRRDEFRGSPRTVEILRTKENVELVLGARPKEFVTDDNKLVGLVVSKADGCERTLAVGGVFAAVGQVPNTEFLRGVVALDEHGYVIASENCRTNVEGIFAAGDCRTKSLRQLTTAAADGAVAASSIRR